MNAITVDVSLVPVRYWWQPQRINAKVGCSCGFAVEINVLVKEAKNGLPESKCPSCSHSMNLVAVSVAGRIFAGGAQQRAERN